MEQINDSTLLGSIQRGDELAFSHIVDRYGRNLLRHICKRVPAEDAKDILQNIFMSLWNNRMTIIIGDSLSPYLFGAARYEVIDYLVKSEKQLVRQAQLVQPEAEAPAAEGNLLARELQQELDITIRKMPSTMRTVFQLSRYDHLSVKEIATRLDLSEQTVKNNISQALQRLRLFLQQHPLLGWEMLLCYYYIYHLL